MKTEGRLYLRSALKGEVRSVNSGTIAGARHQTCLDGLLSPKPGRTTLYALAKATKLTPDRTINTSLVMPITSAPSNGTSIDLSNVPSVVLSA